MQNEETLRIRTLYHSLWIGLVTNAALFGLAPRGWAWGFLVGAVMSLFSALSLIVIVPLLFRPGANEHTKGLLSATLFMKIPLYMVGLYIGTNVKGVEPMAMMCGILLVPTVITLRAIHHAMQDAAQHRSRQPRRQKPAAQAVVTDKHSAARTNAQDLRPALRERG
jgi:hypothetical protein